MEPSRRLSEIGLGQAFFNDTSDADIAHDHLQEVENRDENVCHDNTNPDDEEGKGKSSNMNKRVSISLACLEALQQVRWLLEGVTCGCCCSDNVVVLLLVS